MLIPSGSKVFVLTDSNVAEHCLPELMAHVPAIEAAEIIELDPGEENKSLEIVTHLWAHLLENEADRKSVLINLGGGVI
jgi:3-dehydroquinate synthase